VLAGERTRQNGRVAGSGLRDGMTVTAVVEVRAAGEEAFEAPSAEVRAEARQVVAAELIDRQHDRELRRLDDRAWQCGR